MATCKQCMYWSKGGAVVRALVSHQCGPGLNSWRRRHMWVEFVVGFLPLLREVFLRVLRFSPLLKNQYFQIQFDLESTDMFQ